MKEGVALHEMDITFDAMAGDGRAMGIQGQGVLEGVMAVVAQPQGVGEGPGGVGGVGVRVADDAAGQGLAARLVDAQRLPQCFRARFGQVVRQAAGTESVYEVSERNFLRSLKQHPR